MLCASTQLAGPLGFWVTRSQSFMHEAKLRGGLALWGQGAARPHEGTLLPPPSFYFKYKSHRSGC